MSEFARAFGLPLPAGPADRVIAAGPGLIENQREARVWRVRAEAARTARKKIPMNWNEWAVIWKRQELPRGADADRATLRATFDAKSRKLAKALRAQDLLEASAGIFVAGVLAVIGWQQGRAGWPIAVSIALVLGVSGSFVRECIRFNRTRVGADAPWLARVEGEIAELRHRRRRLLGLGPWYLAPLGAAIVIGCLTLVRNRPAWDIARDPVFLGGYFAFCAVLFWGVWLAGRRSVRRQFDPRIAELEKLRSDLLSPEN
jgi:hypothetical protein